MHSRRFFGTIFSLMCDSGFPLYYSVEALRSQAKALSSRWGFSCLAQIDRKEASYLFLTESGLAICTPQISKNPCYIDFCAQPFSNRKQTFSKRQDPLSKAIGCSKASSLHIWDFTAGFGQDAGILAEQGSKVVLFESSTVIAALLEDALERASAAGLFIHNLPELVFGNASIAAKELLAKRSRPEVVYLDPMYPRTVKQTAAVKQPMQILRYIVGAPQGEADLFLTALEVATQRVVVKRQNKSPPLLGCEPDWIIKAKKIRFDIYKV